MTKKELLKILKPLIKAKTVNPPGNEYLAAKLVTKFLKSINVPYKLYSRRKNRVNVVAKIGNEQKGPKLMINYHMDVVPVGGGWKTDPFITHRKKR